MVLILISFLPPFSSFFSIFFFLLPLLLSLFFIHFIKAYFMLQVRSLAVVISLNISIVLWDLFSLNLWTRRDTSHQVQPYILSPRLFQVNSLQGLSVCLRNQISSSLLIPIRLLTCPPCVGLSALLQWRREVVGTCWVLFCCFYTLLEQDRKNLTKPTCCVWFLVQPWRVMVRWRFRSILTVATATQTTASGTLTPTCQSASVRWGLCWPTTMSPALVS